ncbi:MAG: hypothetical protein M1269_01730 [Chloroflexi bacterium]|nr:hypothetical protein [Chloroflexota bacterium]
MRRIFFLVLILAVTVISAPAADQQARQILDTLYCGQGTLPIQDMIIKAEISKAVGQSTAGQSVIQLDSRDTIFFKRPNLLRVDSMLIDPGGPYEGKLISVIRDGTNRWMFVSMGSYPVKKGSDEPTPTLILPYNMQLYPMSLSKEYVLMGKETVEGVPCDVIRAVDVSNPERIETVWVDTNKRVPLKLEVSAPPEKDQPQAVVTTILYRDIRKLEDGRNFPFKLEFSENNVINKVVVYTDVKVNTGIQDSLFHPMDKFLR